jgi:hypothetical protein
MVIGHSTLMSHEGCWKAYTSASGQYPIRRDRTVEGDQYSDKDWQTDISPILEELEEVEMEVGPRTASYRSIENKIERSVAYTDIGDAVEQGGLWVGEVAYTVETDDGTESRTVKELRIMREDVAQITSQHDVSDRGLQIELKARGLSSPRVSGISESTYVNGSYQTYWCFRADEMPDPEDVADDIADPMDRMDDRDGHDDEEDGNDDEDGDAGGAPINACDGGNGPDAPADTAVDENSDEDGETTSSDENGPVGKMGSYGAVSDNEGENQ